TLALLLYTHYVPGLAALAAFAAVCIWQAARGRVVAPLRDLAVAAGVSLILYAPWIAGLAGAVGKWTGRGETYRAFANPMLDEAAKIGYCLFSFSFGETPPPVALVAAAALLPFVAWLALRGAWPQVASATGAFVLVGTSLAWVGVSRWVSFPFVPARLLFLLPLYLMLMVQGKERSGKVGTALCAGIIAASLLSAGSYFRKADFLNKGYAAPFNEMAALVVSDARDALVVVDAFNTDAHQITKQLPSWLPSVIMRGPQSAEAVRRVVRKRDPRVVWYVRNTHDISPGGLNRKLEQELSRGHATRLYLFQPYSAIERRIIRMAGWPEVPTHFYQVMKVERR
ncbi:MAG: hypothetical protein ACPL88_02080, partial [Bryobacteraceae bacterium]